MTRRIFIIAYQELLSNCGLKNNRQIPRWIFPLHFRIKEGNIDTLWQLLLETKSSFNSRFSRYYLHPSVNKTQASFEFFLDPSIIKYNCWMFFINRAFAGLDSGIDRLLNKSLLYSSDTVRFFSAFSHFDRINEIKCLWFQTNKTTVGYSKVSLSLHTTLYGIVCLLLLGVCLIRIHCHRNETNQNNWRDGHIK